MGLFARRPIRRGECVLTLRWGHQDEVQGGFFSRVYASLDELEDELLAASTARPDGDAYARSILEHSVPAVSGAVYHFSDSAIVAYENHSDEPNVSGMSYRWLDEGPGAEFKKVALRDIDEDEELLVDYNGCSGYDVRDDEAMHRFLALCERYGVEKRPSTFRDN